MRIRLLYIALPVLLVSNIVLSQEFSDEQKNTIASETDKLIEDYQKYGAFSENGKNISTSYVNNFKNLFKNTTNVYIYNDIDPEELLDTSITVMEYIFKVQTWYADGLDIDLSWDASLVSEPVSVDGSNQNFIVSILLQKQVMGVYQSRKIQNNIGDLYFLVEFEKAGRNLRNFKISGIQKERPVLEKPEEKVVVVPRIEKEEVIFVNIFCRPLYSMVYNKDIFSNDFWKAKGGIGYSGGLQFLYLPKKSYGVYAGLSLSNYKSYLKLEDFDNEGNSELLTDKDGDNYYRYIQADVEEWNSLTYLDLSLGGFYALKKDKNITPYISAGAQLSYRLVGKYKIEGSSTHMGYYPDYHVILYDLEDYDFTSENIKSESEWEVNPLLITAYFSCGLRMKLGNAGHLNIGPVIIYGLTDLKYDTAKHRDDYISTIGIPAKTIIQAGGINISFEFTL